MNVKVVKSYVVTVALGAVMLAGFILWALQWGNYSNFSLYGKNIADANTGLIILISLGVGTVLPLGVKILARNVMAVNKSRKQTAVSKPQV